MFVWKKRSKFRQQTRASKSNRIFAKRIGLCLCLPFVSSSCDVHEASFLESSDLVNFVRQRCSTLNLPFSRALQMHAEVLLGVCIAITLGKNNVA